MRNGGITIGVGTLFLIAVALATTMAAGRSTPPATKSLRMYVFSCGTLKNRAPDPYGLTRGQIGPGHDDMADPCFLIVHPRGTLLWETGLNDAEFNRPEGGGAQHDKVDKSLRSQLSDIGYSPAPVSYTHLTLP